MDVQLLGQELFDLYKSVQPSFPYELGNLVGQTYRNIVHVAYARREDTYETLACKTERLLLSGSESEIRHQFREKLHAEIQRFQAAATLKHPNVVEHIALEASYDEKEGYSIRWFMEYCSGGGLTSQWRKSKGGLPIAVVKFYSRQIIRALAYIHQGERVVHNDLKSDNILLAENYTVKVADFGELDKIRGENTQPNEVRPFVGTIRYWPPEKVIDSSWRGRPVDVYSFGCVLLEMVTGELPRFFKSISEGSTPIELKGDFQLQYAIGNGTKPKLPDGLPCDLHDLLDKCLGSDGNLRPTASQLLDHPFFQWSDVDLLKPEVIRKEIENCISTQHENTNHPPSPVSEEEMTRPTKKTKLKDSNGRKTSGKSGKMREPIPCQDSWSNTFVFNGKKYFVRGISRWALNANQRDFRKHAELMMDMAVRQPQYNIIQFIGADWPSRKLVFEGCICSVDKILENFHLRRSYPMQGPEVFDPAMTSGKTAKALEELVKPFLSGDKLVGRNICTSTLLDIAHGISVGLEFLSSIGIAHLDLLTKNVLVGYDLQVKIGGLNCAQEISGQMQVPLKQQNLFKLAFKPPEVIDAIASSKTDVFCFGLILFEIFHFTNIANPNWHAEYDHLSSNTSSLTTLNARPTIHETILPEIANLISSCWISDWKSRPSANLIMWQLRNLFNNHPNKTFKNTCFYTDDYWGDLGDDFYNLQI